MRHFCFAFLYSFCNAFNLCAVPSIASPLHTSQPSAICLMRPVDRAPLCNETIVLTFALNIDTKELAKQTQPTSDKWMNIRPCAQMHAYRTGTNGDRGGWLLFGHRFALVPTSRKRLVRVQFHAIYSSRTRLRGPLVVKLPLTGKHLYLSHRQTSDNDADPELIGYIDVTLSVTRTHKTVANKYSVGYIAVDSPSLLPVSMILGEKPLWGLHLAWRSVRSCCW